jgi:peroxiredoxin Q/BCP
LSGRTAKAARRAAAAEAASTSKPRGGRAPKVKSPQRRVDPVRERRKRLALWSALAVGAAVAGLYAITAVGGSSGGSAGSDSGLQGSGKYVYAVGAPGPGQPAPPITLSSTGGGTFDLATYRGKEQVLLYFQEGLMCQPCWDQIVAIEQEMAEFEELGIGRMVSISGDPLHLIEQKVADERITSPVLSDPNYAVSDSYDARAFGMMDGQMAGHSFILVGKDGKIRWRADYGGEPNYTMFVPTDVVLQHLREGIKQPA